MTRSLALAVVALFALPPSALANPAISLSSARDGSLAGVPAKVKHRLTLTAGATAETVQVRVSPSAELVVGGDTQSVVRPQSGTGPSVAICAGRWSAMRSAYAGFSVQDHVTLTLAPGATAFVEATVQLIEAPRADEGLDATWFIEPAQGEPFDVVSAAPLFRGPLGVTVDMRATRAPDGHIVVTGTADPDVDSGRVELWAFAPRRQRATRIASVRVRTGEWSYSRFRPTVRGRWELYARYRTAGRTYANDATECGTFIRVR